MPKIDRLSLHEPIKTKLFVSDFCYVRVDEALFLKRVPRHQPQDSNIITVYMSKVMVLLYEVVSRKNVIACENDSSTFSMPNCIVSGGRRTTMEICDNSYW